MAEYVTVGPVADIPPGTATSFRHGEEAIGVFNVDGAFYAIDNICPHANAPLADGDLEDELVYCPLHGWTFDVRTGECHFKPGLKVRTFPVDVVDGQVRVDVSSLA